ncbi:MAG: hypothetical protein U9O98_00605 [Asgard group archaeon]|nr:hypothetical protein [Asgard group archaeon]
MTTKKNITYSIENRVSIFSPYERIIAGLNFLASLFYFNRLKTIDFTVDDQKLSVEGPKTILRGDYRLDIKKDDFRGSSVDYRGIKIIGIIISVLLIGLTIFAYIVYFADLFDNDESPGPIIVGTIVFILGVILLIFSLLKVTVITLRFVDKYSNSVRYLKIKVRRNTVEYYHSSKEFLEKLWVSSSAKQ